MQGRARPVVNPSDETIRIGALQVHFLVTGDDSNGTAAILELTVPAGDKLPSPAHSHNAYEETIYGLDGAISWTIDGEVTVLGPGQTLCIRRGAVHRFDNLGEADAKVLTVISPAAIGPEYFREVAEVIDAAAGGPPDRTRMTEVMLRHGLTPAPPPEVA